MNNIKTCNLFSCNNEILKDYFNKTEYPWELLSNLKDFIKNLTSKNLNGYKEVEKEPKKYKDPDWQADFLAGALLMDFEKTEGMTVAQLIDLCKVSEEAAIVHISAAKSLKK